MSQWQLIESAPKGQSVLVAVRYWDGRQFVGEARFHADVQGGSWWWANENDGDYHASSINTLGEVTHWMPLPDPPAVAGEPTR